MKEVKEKIAIVGMSNRFAGSTTPDEYWATLMGGRDQIRTTSRFGDNRAGFVEDAQRFDAGFFRVSPAEATCMDPQQRVLLETVQHAIDDTTMSVDDLRALRCGVYTTSLPGDYKFVLSDHPGIAFSAFSFLGNATSASAGRISYFYDFKGPAQTVDTACSSSLVAVEQACQSLRVGHCHAAIVGAVSIFSTPEIFHLTRHSKMSSPTHRCAPFDTGADGFVPGEGAAALVLMSVDTAMRFGQNILAVIEAVAINHDGFTNGLMAPNPQAQADLIDAALTEAELDLDDLAFIETHGTGTKLGDAIEIEGLRRVAAHRPLTTPVYLGTSKAVVGHTLVCSGLASLIKAVLCLKHRLVPPVPQAAGAIDTAGFVLNRAPTALAEVKACASVSSFGFTGTNAHVILRRVDDLGSSPARAPADASSRHLLVSAESGSSLARKLLAYLELISAPQSDDLARWAAWSQSGVENYRRRVVIDVSSLEAGRRSLSEAIANLIEEASVRAAELMPPRIAEWLTAGVDLPTIDPAGRRAFQGLRRVPYPFTRQTYWPTVPRPQKAPDDRPASTLRDRVATKLAGLLGMMAGDIDLEKSAGELGLDSLSALEVLDVLDGAGIGWTIDQFFSFPSVDRMIAEAERAHFGEASGTPVVATSHERDLLRWESSQNPGKPILLLPPLNMSPRAWDKQVRTLVKSGYQVHVPSYPGHAGNPCAVADVDLTKIPDELHRYVRNRLGTGPVDFVGWSLGGSLSLQTCLRHPESVRSLFLISSAARFGEEFFDRALKMQDELKGAKEELDIFFGPSERVVDPVSGHLNMNTLKVYFDYLDRFDVATRIEDIAVPTRYVYGSNDPVIGAEEAELFRRISGAAVCVYPDQGHFIPLRDARTLNADLIRFLNQGGGGARVERSARDVRH